MYITLTKKRIFIIFCAVVLAFILITQYLSVKANGIEISTNAQRVQFISTLGVDLQSDEFEQKQVVIPQEFSDVYKNYNTLQRTAGFDLTAFCGKQVTVYTYRTTDNKVVNLMIYKDKLIGGDIADLSVEGEMTALKGNKNVE